MSCGQFCLKCNDSQKYKINFSKYHGICENCDFKGSLKCIHCDSTVFILFRDLILSCQKCYKFENLSRGHVFCDFCLENNECTVCKSNPIDNPKVEAVYPNHEFEIISSNEEVCEKTDSKLTISTNLVFSCMKSKEEIKPENLRKNIDDLSLEELNNIKKFIDEINDKKALEAEYDIID